MGPAKLAVLLSALLVAAHGCGGTVSNTDVLQSADDGGHEFDASQDSDRQDAFDAAIDHDSPVDTDSLVESGEQDAPDALDASDHPDALTEAGDGPEETESGCDGDEIDGEADGHDPDVAPVLCVYPFAECDNDPSTLCETSLNTLTDCKACGNVCPAGMHCSPMGCECEGGWADCDGLYDNGCETSLTSNAANCGGCGNSCDAGQVCHNGACGCAPEACVPATCQGHTYACGDCIDNDMDGLIDAQDPGCTGACDATEDAYAPLIPGTDTAPCHQDCYFDLDGGSGNDDCWWDHRCDPLEVAPQYDPESKCKYNPTIVIGGKTCAQFVQGQSLQCMSYCGPLVPNGCDCFGCCELPAGSGLWVWLGSKDTYSNVESCTPSAVTDPAKCRPCTPVPSCINPCEHCELCIGKQALPSDCAVQQCATGHQPCGLPCQPGCDPGSYCVAGCCQANAI